MATIAERVTALEGQVATINSKLNTLTTRVNNITSRVNNLESADAGHAARLTTLESKANAQDAKNIAQDTRIGVVEEGMANAATVESVAALEQRIAALEGTSIKAITKNQITYTLTDDTTTTLTFVPEA